MSTFLDVLPTDIYNNIAYHLFSSIECNQYDYMKGRFGLRDDEGLKALLEYAKNSSPHLNSVMYVMSHRLYITGDWREETVADWISATAGELQELNILEAPRLSFPGQVPKLLNLRKAAVTTAPEQLSLIRGCPNLSGLRVNIETTHEWDNFVSTIASLPVKSLHLFFSSCQENGVTRNHLENLSRSSLMWLRAACPIVEKLYLNPAGMRMTSSAWEMIRGMPCLKTLGLRGRDTRSKGHIPFIKTMAEIEIYDASRISETRCFGSAVTLLEVATPSSYEQILGLTSFPNLQKLKLVLHRGAEGALTGKISNVQELCISWSFSQDSYPLENFDGNPQTLIYPLYHEPDTAILENILKTTYTLKTLKLGEAILSSEAIERLLATVSDNLENLELCHDWQNESAAGRMERIIKAVTRYCPNLVSLMFLENSSMTRYYIMSTENQKRRCFKALQRLISARPGFKSYRIIRSTIKNRFVDEHPFNMLLWEDILPN